MNWLGGLSINILTCRNALLAEFGHLKLQARKRGTRRFGKGPILGVSANILADHIGVLRILILKGLLNAYQQP